MDPEVHFEAIDRTGRPRDLTFGSRI